jgi:Bifunctional PLP-dependent enzyme with beta-cystathionase and maltose regulon repressor activities
MLSVFDEIVDREHTDSVKYILHSEKSCTIPMWVADMDFKMSKQVLDALSAVTRHGIFGYTNPDESYNQAVCEWYR